MGDPAFGEQADITPSSCSQPDGRPVYVLSGGVEVLYKQLQKLAKLITSDPTRSWTINDVAIPKSGLC